MTTTELPKPPGAVEIDGFHMYAIGEDETSVIAFGRHDKELFFKAAQKWWRQVVGEEMNAHGYSFAGTPSSADVDHRMVEFIDDPVEVSGRGWDDWGIIWSEGADRRTPITILSEG